MRPGQAGWMADSGLRYGRVWGAGVAGPGGVYRGTHRTYAKNLKNFPTKLDSWAKRGNSVTLRHSTPRIAYDPTETLPRR